MPLIVALLLCALASAAEENATLNLIIPVFDAAVPEDPENFGAIGVFPRIREVEALLWPFGLREEIVRTGVFQTVRVVPETDEGADLTVLGKVLESDGFQFSFQLTMLDATGTQWYQQDYSGTTSDDKSGFATVFRRAAEDLAGALASKSAAELKTITNTSALRYAARIAPSAFEGYVAARDDGRFELVRLPARDDPMLQRIATVRETEFVVDDEIDENYAELSSEVSSIYKIWRDYRRQNVNYQIENERRAQFDRNAFPQASFERFKRLYDVYKWDRQTVQEQDQLALAFDNEVSPILEKIELRVAELEVFVDRKNAEWYRLLEALFELETQLAPE
jgi:hypothetical protein